MLREHTYTYIHTYVCVYTHNPFPPSLCQESFACARLLARPPSLPVPSSLLPVRHHKYAALESPFSRGVGVRPTAACSCQG